MGGLFGGGGKAFAPLPKPEAKKSTKADAGADAITKDVSGAKATIGLNRLGETTSLSEEGTVTTVGSSPANKKKPTVFLLGEKP